MTKIQVLDRRGSIRAKRILSIEYRLIKSQRKNADKSWRLSTTDNMSVGGLAFYTECEYRAGDLLQIRVVMSGVLDIFNGYGKVVRVDRKRTGSYFLIGLKFLGNKTKSRDAKTFVPTNKLLQRRSLKRV